LLSNLYMVLTSEFFYINENLTLSHILAHSGLFFLVFQEPGPFRERALERSNLWCVRIVPLFVDRSEKRLLHLLFYIY